MGLWTSVDCSEAVGLWDCEAAGLWTAVKLQGCGAETVGLWEL